MRMIICTGNAGKLREIRTRLPEGFEAITLADAGLPADLPEDGDTLEANALQKARYAFERTGLPCLADDSGLEVRALGGRPGPLSARYAGEPRDDEANMALLLRELSRAADRAARFRTVLAWVTPAEARLFEGTVEGSIALERRGSGGFGYDPLFVAAGEARTFAEMQLHEKQAISHRARAMNHWLAYLLGR